MQHFKSCKLNNSEKETPTYMVIKRSDHIIQSTNTGEYFCLADEGYHKLLMIGIAFFG